MKSKKGERSILYKKWKEEHKEAQEIETISQDIGVNREKIIVKKVSTLAKTLEMAQEVFFKVIRIAAYMIVMVLASLGTTVILNAELRKVVIDTLLGYLR